MSVRLFDLPLPVLRALRDGDADTAAVQIGLQIPADFLGNTAIWSFMIDLIANRPANAGWTTQGVARDGVVVGNAGFKGAPSGPGEVEIGYFILAAHRGQGLAVTAVRLLLERARNEPTVSRVVATIDPDNDPSIAVITRAGFISAGERMHERWGRQLLFTYGIRQPPVTD